MKSDTRPQMGDEELRVALAPFEKAPTYFDLANDVIVMKDEPNGVFITAGEVRSIKSAMSRLRSPQQEGVNAKLLARLKPFSDFAEWVATKHQGWDHDDFHIRLADDFMITMAPFRAAREAITTTQPAPVCDPGLEHDGLRWRALVNSPRLRMQGWAGFDAQGRFEQTMDPRGYMHFGMEVWSHSEDESGSLARTILTEYADQRIKQSVAAKIPRPNDDNR